MALAGVLVVWAGYNTTLLALAALGAVLFWLFMPETRDKCAVAEGGRITERPAA